MGGRGATINDDSAGTQEHAHTHKKTLTSGSVGDRHERASSAADFIQTHKLEGSEPWVRGTGVRSTTTAQAHTHTHESSSNDPNARAHMRVHLKTPTSGPDRPGHRLKEDHQHLTAAYPRWPHKRRSLRDAYYDSGCSNSSPDIRRGSWPIINDVSPCTHAAPGRTPSAPSSAQHVATPIRRGCPSYARCL